MNSVAISDLRTHLGDLFHQALAKVAPDAANTEIILERPKQAQHGDYACNLALQLAKALKRKPREIATELIGALPASPYLAKTEIAGAGFINCFFKPEAHQSTVAKVLAEGLEIGRAHV